MWVNTEDLPTSDGHPFFERLNRVLEESGFDAFVEGLCEAFYACRLGRPSLRPGRYFRLLFIGYFEGVSSERGIAWRVADSLSLRSFLDLDMTEAAPDHSTLSRTRRRIDVETHEAVFTWVLERVAEAGLVRGKTVGIDATTLEANAAMRSIERHVGEAARAAAPAYTELCEQVRNAPVVTPDETGWRVGGEHHWLWVFTTPDTTVYAICPGRGFDDAATVLGTDYAGVLVRDGWAPYRCYDGLHQTCLNHLLQRCKHLREDHPDNPWAGEVQAVLQAGLDLRDRCNAGELSEHGMATARGRLNARLARLIDAPPPLDDAERFAAHLANEFPAVFLFLWDPSLDATNWRAEQAIRPAVVIRKVCGGNRTRHGADTQQVLASIVRSARQRGLDLPPLIAALLRAPEPAVPELLGLPPPTA